MEETPRYLFNNWPHVMTVKITRINPDGTVTIVSTERDGEAYDQGIWFGVRMADLTITPEFAARLPVTAEAQRLTRDDVVAENEAAKQRLQDETDKALRIVTLAACGREEWPS